jgi:hypothetical protein
MSSKLLKAQFNKMHTGAILLDVESVSMFAGRFKDNMIEVSRDGINIQTGPGKSITLNSLDIRGPLHKQSSIPMDFLPGFTNPTPRKTLYLPVVDTAGDLVAISSIYSAVVFAGGF